jgi:diaminopimelate epimerase
VTADYSDIYKYQSSNDLCFSKMQGCGNHFSVAATTLEFARNINPETIKKICSVHFGIGADGVFFIHPITASSSKQVDFGVYMYNPDGSAMGMCGNGIRCVALFIDKYLDRTNQLSAKGLQILVDDSTVIECKKNQNGFVRVEMGQGVVIDQNVVNLKDGTAFEYDAVTMPNPHAIIVCKELPTLDRLKTVGPEIETHKNFPNRTNVEFVQIKNSNTVQVMVWERAAGITQACGTGACATVLSLHNKGLVAAKCDVILPGGQLSVEVYSRDGVQYLSLIGPQNEVFVGKISLN